MRVCVCVKRLFMEILNDYQGAPQMLSPYASCLNMFNNSWGCCMMLYPTEYSASLKNYSTILQVVLSVHVYCWHASSYRTKESHLSTFEMVIC